jgi:hypothetical protein
MHPAIAIPLIFAAGAIVFWLILAGVDRLQKGKKKNFPALDPATEHPDDDRASFSHGTDSIDGHH